MSTNKLSIGGVLGQYRVLEQIGSGGMGVVYRAHDENLERDVAIKVLPPDMLGDDSARRRFRREGLALSRLNHPNIATVHDFETQDGIDLLVTEYVPGITLDVHIAHQPRPEQEVIAVGLQLADGLQAAHAEGIVHRDLKPGNLRLRPDGMLKILDFGLARQVTLGDARTITTAITQSQQISGTLPYMAPEQLRGEAVDARGDLWSAGAVLYEMATGSKPFPSDNAALLIDSILNKAPAEPVSLNPRISSGLQYVIVHCLEKDPALRYQSAAAMRADLYALQTHSRPVAPRPRRSPRWPLAAVAALLLLAVAGSIVGYRKLRAPHPSAAEFATKTNRRSVAVLGFKNLSGRSDQNWLSTAISELLTTELAAGEQLRTVPGESVARVKLDLGVAESETLAADTLKRLRKNLSADWVVAGSFLALGDSGGEVRLDVHVQDATTGENIASFSEKGSPAQLDDLVMRVGSRIRERLGASEISSSERAQVRAATPANAEAARLYSQGLEKLRVFDAMSARDLLSRAAKLEPDFAPIHSALATAWGILGYDERARQEATLAFTNANGLSRQERLSIEGIYRELTNDQAAAKEIYRTLFEFFPDDLQYGLKLANIEIGADDAKTALATIASLRNLPVPQRDDPAIDLTEAFAQKALGDSKAHRAAAATAANKAEASGARLLAARAYLEEGGALRSLGEMPAAISSFKKADALYSAVGDRVGSAHALNGLGNIYTDQANYAEARKSYEAALAVYRSVDNKMGMAGTLENIAAILSDRGDVPAGMKLSEEALALYNEIGDRRNAADTLSNIGAEYVQMGNLAEGEKRFQQSLITRRAIGDRNGEAISLANLGDVAQARGNLAKARDTYTQTLAIFRELGRKPQQAYPLAGLAMVALRMGDLDTADRNLRESATLAKEGDDANQSAYVQFFQAEVAKYRGDLSTARQFHEQVLASRRQLAQKSTEAESQLALVQLALLEKRPQDALPLALDAAKEFEVEKRAEDAADAHAAAAIAHLAVKRTSSAQIELRQATSLAARAERPDVSAHLNIATAKISPSKENARKLENLAAEAQRRGDLLTAFELQLASAEVLAGLGEVDQAKSQLAQLRKEAQAKGVLLFVQQVDAFK